jgi:hypothetical protein
VTLIFACHGKIAIGKEQMMPTPSETKIEHALDYANEWLKFGETKHAITLNTASITIMHNLVKGYMCWHPCLPGWLWFATVCCIVSAVISLASFFAHNTSWNTPVKILSGGANLVSFGQSREAMKNAFADDGRSDFMDRMAEQTVINSAIALRKAKFFNVALIFYILGPVLLAAASVILVPRYSVSPNDYAACLQAYGLAAAK